MTSPNVDVAVEDEPVTGAFNPDDYDWYNHIKVALKELQFKVPELDLQWRYYDGEHPRFWLTDQLKDMFDHDLSENMSENWCDFAVDAPVKRLGVTGWVNKEDNTVHTKAAENIFKDNDLELEQKELYRQARAVGESFAFVWKDDDKEFGIDINIQDARNVWWPKDAHRNDPTRVVQVWMDEDEGIWRATVYYRYVIVRLTGPKINQAQTIPDARYFDVDENDPGGIHGFEKVPVIRFAIQKRRKGVINQIKHIQDKINKLVANKLVAAEFNAWGKTVIMTQQDIDDGDLRIRPDRFLKLDPGGGDNGVAPTSIWESSPLELLNYDQSIGTEIDKLFTMAGLPGHMQVRSTVAVPSGAAYEADEGPFVEMIGDMQDTFGASWSDLLELCEVECKPQWRNPAIRSDADEATTVKAFKDAGMPLSLALKYYAGWTDDQLLELEDAPLSPQETQALAMSQALGGINAAGSGANQEGGDNGDNGQPVGSDSGASGQKPSPSNLNK